MPPGMDDAAADPKAKSCFIDNFWLVSDGDEWPGVRNRMIVMMMFFMRMIVMVRGLPVTAQKQDAQSQDYHDRLMPARVKLFGNDIF